MEITISPCIRNCCLDDNDICLGCFRSIEEITQWSNTTEKGKQDIIKLCHTRHEAHKRKYKPLP